MFRIDRAGWQKVKSPPKRSLDTALLGLDLLGTAVSSRLSSGSVNPILLCARADDLQAERR